MQINIVASNYVDTMRNVRRFHSLLSQVESALTGYVMLHEENAEALLTAVHSGDEVERQQALEYFDRTMLEVHDEAKDFKDAWAELRKVGEELERLRSERLGVSGIV